MNAKRKHFPRNRWKGMVGVRLDAKGGGRRKKKANKKICKVKFIMKYNGPGRRQNKICKVKFMKRVNNEWGIMKSADEAVQHHAGCKCAPVYA